MKIKSYNELILLDNFEDRFNYLKLTASIGVDTFGFDRYLNQMFYKSNEWKNIRRKVIARDYGCDLGLRDYPIYGKIIVHHMNPISKEDIKDATEFLLNPNYLICVSNETHNAIHYSQEYRKIELIERTPNDTCPWRT